MRGRNPISLDVQPRVPEGLAFALGLGLRLKTSGLENKDTVGCIVTG